MAESCLEECTNNNFNQALIISFLFPSSPNFFVFVFVLIFLSETGSHGIAQDGPQSCNPAGTASKC